MSSQQPIACEGDTTSAGGHILEGDSAHTIDGLSVAFEGAQVLCHVHGMTHIAEATARITVYGRRIARQGDLLACGHHIVVLGERRATSDHYSDEGDSYTNVGSGLPKHGMRSAQASGRATRDNIERPIDAVLEFELRLLCGQGRPHSGLSYINTLASARGTVTQTSPEGLTTPLSCCSNDVALVAIAVPDMESK